MKTSIAVLALFATPAFAHAHLEKSDPAPGARVAAPRVIVLRFSEKLEPAFSGAQLLDAAARPVAAKALVAGDTINLTPPVLKPGAYQVHWHSVGRDTHRMTGSFTFSVTR